MLAAGATTGYLGAVDYVTGYKITSKTDFSSGLNGYSVSLLGRSFHSY